MGYYTNYELAVKDFKTKESVPVEKYVKEIENIIGYDPFDEPSKWYEFEENMKDISKKHPDKIFIIYGEGEEAGDIFKYYFYQGKVQREELEISFKDFDINKLED